LKDDCLLAYQIKAQNKVYSTSLCASMRNNFRTPKRKWSKQAEIRITKTRKGAPKTGACNVGIQRLLHCH